VQLHTLLFVSSDLAFLKVKLPLLDPFYFVQRVETHPLIKNNQSVFDLLMEARKYHVTGEITEHKKIVPRQNAATHQVR